MPHGSVAVHGHLVVIAEILAQYFQVLKVRVAPENHALLVVFERNLVAFHILHKTFLRVFQLFARIAEVKIKLAVGAEHKGVHPVVVLLTGNALENNFLLVGFVIAVFIREQIHIRALRHQHPVAHHPHAQRRVEFGALVKHLVHIRFAIAIGVFQDHNPVAFLFNRVAIDLRTVIVSLAHPHTAPRVHVNVGGVGEHGFGGKQRRIQPFGDFEASQCVFGQAFLLVRQLAVKAVQHRFRGACWL